MGRCQSRGVAPWREGQPGELRPSARRTARPTLPVSISLGSSMRKVELLRPLGEEGSMTASRLPADAHQEANTERLRLVTDAMNKLASGPEPNIPLLARLDQIARSLRIQMRR